MGTHIQLIHSFQSHKNGMLDNKSSLDERLYLSSKYQLMVSSVLMASLPHLFPAILHQLFKGESWKSLLSAFIGGGFENKEDLNMDIDERCKSTYEVGEMDIDEHYQLKKLSKKQYISQEYWKSCYSRPKKPLFYIYDRGYSYASAIFLLLKDKVEELAGDDCRSSVSDFRTPLKHGFRMLLFYSCIIGDFCIYD